MGNVGSMIQFIKRNLVHSSNEEACNPEAGNIWLYKSLLYTVYMLCKFCTQIISLKCTLGAKYIAGLKHITYSKCLILQFKSIYDICDMLGSKFCSYKKEQKICWSGSLKIDNFGVGYSSWCLVCPWSKWKRVSRTFSVALARFGWEWCCWLSTPWAIDRALSHPIQGIARLVLGGTGANC